MNPMVLYPILSINYFVPVNVPVSAPVLIIVFVVVPVLAPVIAPLGQAAAPLIGH